MHNLRNVRIKPKDWQWLKIAAGALQVSVSELLRKGAVTEAKRLMVEKSKVVQFKPKEEFIPAARIKPISKAPPLSEEKSVKVEPTPELEPELKPTLIEEDDGDEIPRPTDMLDSIKSRLWNE